jgi:alpha-N-arabinofuranosidase
MNVARGSLSGKTGFANSGFYGISVKKQKYTGVFWVKGDYKGSFTASLQSGLTGETFGSVEIESMSSNTEWTEHAIEITPTKDAPSSNNTFSITFDPAV